MRQRPSATTDRRRPPRPKTRSARPALDPYVVVAHTWTREELLAARGEDPTPHHRAA